MTRSRKIRLVEFFVIGLVFGVGEDLLAILVVTGEQPNYSRLWLMAFVALPFAIISELIVDHPKFWAKIWPEKKV